MSIYAGIDLHSDNNYIVMMDDDDRVIYQKRLVNDVAVILNELSPHRDSIKGIVIESTYNWYWLADELIAAGYKVHLANTTAIKQYSGLKYTDDKSDARWLAKLLRLNLLTEGYIYPKEKRGTRELLRRRMIMVRQQTMCLLGIQGMIKRYENIKISSTCIKSSEKSEDLILKFIKDQDVRQAVQCQLRILRCIHKQISEIEELIFSKIKNNKAYYLLKTIPGVGPILALTIMLETGEISRFNNPGNFSSYCRCVESKRISNAKKKGQNNRKNGNQYLGWAFVEAANFAIRYNASIKKYHQRKLVKTNRIIAIKTIANKLSKACYFILRDGVEFDMKKAFGEQI